MTQGIVNEKQQEILEILALAEEGEKQLKSISDRATELSQKCKTWYDEGKKNKQQHQEIADKDSQLKGE